MSDLILDPSHGMEQPALIVAFTGWSDAVEASSRAVGFLRDTLQAKPVGGIRADDYYDLTTVRPHAVIRHGVLRALQYPGTTIYAWKSPISGGRDLLLLEAAEPSARWPAYCEAVMELVSRCDVQAVYCVGSLFDAVAHTRPARVSIAVGQIEVRQALTRLGLPQVNYEGPSSVHSALLEACRMRRIPSASFWGHVPAYAQLSWNPRITLALLHTVQAALDLRFDLRELEPQATQIDELLDRLVESDADLGRQVREYERRYDQDAKPSILPSADTILNQVEELLRTHQEGDEEEDQGAE